MRPGSTTWREAISFCALYLCDCEEEMVSARRGERLPKLPTVYMHEWEGRIEYVGQTADLFARTGRHELDRAKGRRRYDRIHWFVPGIPGLQTRLVVETILIAAARPPGNKALLLRLSGGNLSEIRYRRRGRRKAG